MDLSRQFLKLLYHFRRQDLVTFADEHARLYEEAKQSGDYGQCIGHYYSIMSTVIEEYFGGSFHFVPPICAENVPLKRGKLSSIPLQDSLRELHLRIGKCLNLGPGKNCLDIGCGIGQVIEHLAFSGANLVGLTIAPNEVAIGNTNFHALGIHTNCRLVEADCAKYLPFPDESQDSAYAIYSLKYMPNLVPIFAELARVIKPGGLFLVYDLIKTAKFDGTDPKHSYLLAGLEFACGMPPLHSRAEILDEATRAGFRLVRAEDLQHQIGLPFFHCFAGSSLFMWMMRSPLIGKLIKIAQTMKIFPRGFHRFNKIFLSGTVDKIVRAGEIGILSGSEILLFQKE